MNLTIRPAEPRDWPSIWPIVRDVAAAGETFALDRDLTEDRARAMWIEAPPGLTVVALNGDDEMAGSAKMGRNRDGPGAHVATASFMVAAPARRRGVGRALGRYALAWANQQGFLAMQFNAVVEANRVAVKLWRELGFTIVGTVPEAFDHPDQGLVGLHVMHRYLR